MKFLSLLPKTIVPVEPAGSIGAVMVPLESR
jgi:hypothetical protein